MLSDDEYLDIMQMMQLGLSSTYKKYVNNSEKLMSFKDFIRFCGDYDLFPAYSSKSQLF